MEQKSQTAPRTITFLLDGFWGNHFRWEGLRNRIESKIGPCRIWRYDTSGRTSLEKEGATLRQELERCDAPINIVGYSMGGIVIREAVRTLSRPIERAVFLHSPHRVVSLLCFSKPAGMPRDAAWKPSPRTPQSTRLGWSHACHMVRPGRGRAPGAFCKVETCDHNIPKPRPCARMARSLHRHA